MSATVVDTDSEADKEMNWFQQLNAKPKLLIAFGVPVFLLLGISTLAVIALGQSNDRILLMQRDEAKIDLLNRIEEARQTLDRTGKDAFMNMQDPVALAMDERALPDAFAAIQTSLDALDKLLYTARGKSDAAAMRGALPEYRKAYNDLLAQTGAHNVSSTRDAFDAVKAAGAPFAAALRDLSDQQRQLGVQKVAAAAEAYRNERILLYSASGLGVALCAWLATAIAGSFSRPLRRCMHVLERVSGGDLTVTLQARGQDEIGRMMTALSETVARLREALRQVAASAANGSASSRELTISANTIAQGAQEQAAGLEQTSASLEEITATVRHSAENARQASQMALEAKSSAVRGNEAVFAAMSAMEEINHSSAKISDITSTIDEIAFQTNLLAINAAVEAARAGQEGRGFAVVAAEVRSLAGRSAGAAKEIKGLIQDSLRKVEKGSQLVERTGETLQDILGAVARVTDIVGEIASASAEQSRGVDQVGSALESIDRATQSYAGESEEMAATAASMAGEADRLTKLVGSFQLDEVDAGSAPAGAPPPPRAFTARIPARQVVPGRKKASPAGVAKSDAVEARAAIATGLRP